MVDNSSSDFIYPPSRSIKVALDEYRLRSSVKISLDWGLPEIDSRVVPAIPGDLISILGRPSMGKTYMMIYLAKRFESIINQSKKADEKNIIVYATWETLVEEFVGILSSPVSGFTLEDIGKGVADLRAVEAAVITILGQRIVVFGRSKDNRRNPKPPNLFQLDEALNSLTESGYTIKALLIDYLQRIPIVDEQGRNITARLGKVVGTADNLEYIKNIAIRHGVPVFLAVQASRDVDKYPNIRFPQLDDGQWTSNVEQTSDKVFSLTLPAKYMKNTEVKFNGWRYKVGEDTLGIKMLKQRFGPSDMSDQWFVKFNFKNLDVGPHDVLGESEMEQVPF